MAEQDQEPEGEQTAVLSLADIQAQAQRRLLDQGASIIDEAKQTIADLDDVLKDD